MTIIEQIKEYISLGYSYHHIGVPRHKIMFKDELVYEFSDKVTEMHYDLILAIMSKHNEYRTKSENG